MVCKLLSLLPQTNGIMSMVFRNIILGAVALLAANAAHASVLFDNVTGVASDGFTGPRDGGQTTIMGASFTASVPNFSAISLSLAAGSAATTGSTLIYLVPDDGTGSANGISGRPIIENSSGTFTGSFTGSQLIGTIKDRSLTTGFSTISLWVDPMINTMNKEYWVVAVSNMASSFEWSYAADGTGNGTADQGYFNNYSGSDLLPSSDVTGGYQLVVATSEPTTIAILGAGLAGIGLVRRRSMSNA